jgi:thiamine-monophosphate kinase
VPTSASKPSPAARSRASPFSTALSRRPQTLAELGEYRLLRSIAPYLDRPSADLVVAAPNDDAAVWRGDPLVAATTDTMVEAIDFRLEWPRFDFRTLGRRLIAINLSDLAGMGAEPRYALVSLCLRGTMLIADVRRLYRGIAEEAHRFQCKVAGGDLSGTLGPISLTATLVGRLGSKRAMLLRDGARPGWQLAVTGRLGAAAAGLRLLESGSEPGSPVERGWVAAQLDPVPRIAAGRALVEAGVTVGGDISDGLRREVERLVEPGHLGATIDIQRLPLARGLRRKQWPLAVTDSEDFELICAAPRARMEAAQRALQRIDTPLTVIGVIDARPGIRFTNGARLERLEAAGYEHFR